MLLDIEQENNNLTLSYFNKEGKTGYKVYDLGQFRNWVICGENDKYKSDEFTNWDGGPVKSIKAKRLNKFSIYNFLEELPKEEKADIFGDNLPDTYFCDIEVEITEGFPHPEKAENKILTVSIVTPKKQVIVLGLEDLTAVQQRRIKDNTNKYFKKFGHKWDFKYIQFKSEYDLVYTFLDKFVKKFPMMTGWNFIRFDWTYILNRCKRLKIDASVASPTGKLDGRDSFPVHVGVIDYMDLYQNWDRTISVKESSALDYVSNTLLKIGKIKYNGNLQDLYNDDFEKYIYYNAVDSILVYLIDEKLKTMQTLLTLANICKIPIYKAASPVTITESLLARKFLKMGKVLGKDFNDNREGKSAQYTGAYVKEPVIGMHKAVASFDFASLYPSIMRQYNISPDSFIKKVPKANAKDEESDKTLVAVNGSVYERKDSILKTTLAELYAQRKEYKAKSFQYRMLADAVKKRLKSL